MDVLWALKVGESFTPHAYVERDRGEGGGGNRNQFYFEASRLGLCFLTKDCYISTFLLRN